MKTHRLTKAMSLLTALLMLFALCAVPAHEDGARVTFNLSNETLQAFSGFVQVCVRTQMFEDVFRRTNPVTADALSAADVGSFDFTDTVAGREADSFLEFRLSDAEGAVLSTSVLLFGKPKCFRYRKPTYRLSVTRLSECLYRLRLQSDVFAHKVRVDFPGCGADSEDQYLNLASPDGVTYLLRTETDLSAEELQHRAAFFSVYDLAPECMGDSSRDATETE